MNATSLQQPRDTASDYATTAFIVAQLLGRLATAALVKVVSCTNSGGVSPVGLVSVIPLVSQVTGDGTSVPHGTIYRLPYFRLQGGANAVILDPQPDDIGVAVFCSRDSSAAKANPAAAVANANAGKGTPPGSARQYDMADGLYVGGFLNGVPVQYVRFYAGGITVLSPTKVRVEAPTIELVGNVHQTAGDVTMSQKLDVTGDTTVTANLAVNGAGGVTVPSGDVVAGAIGLKTHKHPTAPTGPVSPPIP